MTSSDDPKLGDLKKLLRRINKIDPEQRRSSPTRPNPSPEKNHNPSAPAASDALRLQQALAEPASSTSPPSSAPPAADALLSLQNRTDREASAPFENDTPDLPAIVKRSLPVVTETEPGNGSMAMRTVLIASITAAVVSGLATAGTVFWLTGGFEQVLSSKPVPLPTTQITKQLERPTRTADLDEAPVSEQPPQQTSLAAQAEPANAQDAEQTAPASEAQVAEAEITPPKPRLASVTPDEADNASSSSSSSSSSGAAEPEAASSDEAVVPAQAAPTQAGTGDAAEPATSGPDTDQLPLQVASVETTSAKIAAEVISDRERIFTPLTTVKDAPDRPIATVTKALQNNRVLFVGADSTPPVSVIVAQPTDANSQLNSDAAIEVAARTIQAVDAPLEEADENQAEAANTQPAGSPEPQVSALAETPAQIDPPKVPTLVAPQEVDIPVGTAFDFPVHIDGPADELEGHYVLIDGLKRGSRPSEGIELVFDTWRLNVDQMSGLKMTVPAGFAHRMRVNVQLRRPDGTTRQQASVVFKMPGDAQRILRETVEPQSLSAEARDQTDQGAVQIDNGNLPAARVLFGRAADAGSISAALLMAGSYDPSFVDLYKTTTAPQPDVDVALTWYKRAMKLGSDIAASRIAELARE